MDPDMLAQAILQACSPAACIHLALAPAHTPLPLLLIPLPLPAVSIATAIAHDALPVLQIILPFSCKTDALDCLVENHGLWESLCVVARALPYLSLQCRHVEAAQGRRYSQLEQELQHVNAQLLACGVYKLLESNKLSSPC